MPLTIGDTFAGYRVLRLLGSGGMGEVYLVQHPRLPRQEALKVLRREFSQDESFRERFIREADLASGLRHPHIVGIHDRGEHDGQLWIAMDYIDGTDLSDLVENHYPRGMPIRQASTIVTAIAAALDYAHRKGLLHRDVKPANIIVSDLQTDDPKIYLADFGIARPVDDTSGITTTNMTVGTVAYAAPEQLMGEDIDGRADQYALAATTFHLLTGVQVFPHSNPAVVISRHLNTPPPALSTSHPKLANLDIVLAYALCKTPADRYTRCGDFARALAEEPPPGSAGSSSLAPTQLSPAARRSESAPTGTTLDESSDAASPGPQSRRRLFTGTAFATAITVAAIAILVWQPWKNHVTDESGINGQSAPSTAIDARLTTPALLPTVARPPTTTTPPKPVIVDVDPNEYASTDAAGYYYWTYAVSPVRRDCGVSPNYPNRTPRSVWCSVDFPVGTPEVALPGSPLYGEPNIVHIVPPNGPENSLTEGGAMPVNVLPPDHRITIGPFSCVALPLDGIDCSAPTGGFRFENGVLSRREGG